MMVLEERFQKNTVLSEEQKPTPSPVARLIFKNITLHMHFGQKLFVVFLCLQNKIPNPKVVIQSHKFFSNFFSLIPPLLPLSQIQGGEIGIEAPTVIQQRCYLNQITLPLRVCFIFIMLQEIMEFVLFSPSDQGGAQVRQKFYKQ